MLVVVNNANKKKIITNSEKIFCESFLPKGTVAMCFLTPFYKKCTWAPYEQAKSLTSKVYFEGL